MLRNSLLALLLCASSVFAVEPPKLPKEVAGVAGQVVSVTAETTESTTVKFFVIDNKGLTVIPTSELKDTKKLIVVGVPGRYRVIAWTAGKDGVPSDAAETLIIIKGNDDGGGNVDVDVEPTSPLYLNFKSSYNKESDADKLAKVKKLAASYRDTAKSLSLSSTPTAGDVFRTAATKRSQAIGDSLTLVRDIGGTAVGALLGNDPDAKLTETSLRQVVQLLNEMASYLERIK
jgi:hypothetical protein